MSTDSLFENELHTFVEKINYNKLKEEQTFILVIFLKNTYYAIQNIGI